MTTPTVAASSNGGWSSPAAVLFLRVVRIAVAAGLLWFALRDVEWPGIRGALSRASLWWVVVAVALTILDRLLMLWRWVALVRAVDPSHRVATGPLLRVFFVSGFLGTFLPGGGLSGDTVRALAATRQGVSMANAVASVVVDRLLGTLAVLLMGVGGLLLVGRLEDARLLPAAMLLAAVVGGGTWLLLFDARMYRLLLRWSGANRVATVDRLSHKFLDASGQYAEHRGTLLAVLVASLGVHALRVGQVWALGLAIGLPVPAVWYFAVVPVIVLIMLLPISFAGIGPGNLAFVTFFAPAGVVQDDAFVLSVLFMALSIVGNLPGGLILGFRRSQRDEA